MIISSMGESIKPSLLFLSQEIGFDMSDNRTTGKAGWEATDSSICCVSQGAFDCHHAHVTPVSSPLSQAGAIPRHPLYTS